MNALVGVGAALDTDRQGEHQNLTLNTYCRASVRMAFDFMPLSAK
jgi:hypothetical protein